MNILNGIQNFLELIDNNWTTIVVILSLLFTIYKRIANYFAKSKEEQQAIINEQIDKAKIQISERILKLISDAEFEYEEWIKSGSIKRSQVIGEIFEKYPILSQVTNQEELIQWIDDEIDNALKTLREVIEQNKPAIAVEQKD